MSLLFTYRQHRRVYSWWFLPLFRVNRSTSPSEISPRSCFCYSICAPQSPRMSLLLPKDKHISNHTNPPISPCEYTFTIITSWCMSSFIVSLYCNITHLTFECTGDGVEFIISLHRNFTWFPICLYLLCIYFLYCLFLYCQYCKWFCSIAFS